MRSVRCGNVVYTQQQWGSASSSRRMLLAALTRMLQQADAGERLSDRQDACQAVPRPRRKGIARRRHVCWYNKPRNACLPLQKKRAAGFAHQCAAHARSRVEGASSQLGLHTWPLLPLAAGTSAGPLSLTVLFRLTGPSLPSSDQVAASLQAQQGRLVLQQATQGVSGCGKVDGRCVQS